MKKIKNKDNEFDLTAFIKKELRRAFRRSPMYNEAKSLAKHEYFEKSKTGKSLRRVHFQCNNCQGFFLDKTGRKEIAVDHIEPVIDPKIGWFDYNQYINRLFCSVDKLQILCKNCHGEKTKEENSTRRLALKKQKERIKQQKERLKK